MNKNERLQAVDEIFAVIRAMIEDIIHDADDTQTSMDLIKDAIDIYENILKEPSTAEAELKQGEK